VRFRARFKILLSDENSPTANEVDYLDAVARPHNRRVVIYLGHNLAIDLDRDAPTSHLQAFQQHRQPRVAVDRIRIAVKCD
jgi:hypothetical protein